MFSAGLLILLLCFLAGLASSFWRLMYVIEALSGWAAALVILGFGIVGSLYKTQSMKLERIELSGIVVRYLPHRSFAFYHFRKAFSTRDNLSRLLFLLVKAVV